MARNISKLVKDHYYSEWFQQCSYSTLSKDTGNFDLAAVANEFVSKHSATIPCCADGISQNLQKELFSSVIHHNEGHSVMFFQK